jgi:hypothetical protein
VPYKKLLLESPKLKSSEIFKAIEIAIPSTEIEGEHPDFENRRPAGKIKRIDQGKK